MNKIIGIDLGTTNSCCSVMEGNTPVVIPNKEGGRTTPSVISFDKSGTESRKVGMAAKRQAITNPKGTIYSFKRLIGKTFSQVKELVGNLPCDVIQGKNGSCRVRLGSRDYTPQELAAMVLQKIKASAEDYLGHQVDKAVITVPAYFNDQERQATKEAGEIAGLEVVRIINEPTAAALGYGLDKRDKSLKVVVYDLGGGTFDISILECEEGVFEVKATNGDVNLGGDNFDEILIDWLATTFEKQEGIDLRKDITALQRLKDAAEKAKQELSSAQTTTINLPYITVSSKGPKHLMLDLSRSKFEQLCNELIQRTLAPCRTALQASGFDASDIDEVILVGGSTRIPKVQQEVEKLFGKTPSKGVNPDEVVACGAAIQGGVIAGDVKGIVLLDVTPLSLGIETHGGVFTKLIEANTTIPTKKSEIFSTAENNQSRVDIQVFQGERSIAKYNKLLGSFHLGDIPPAPKGKPQIEVTFDIDVNGIVCVSAKNKETGKANEISVTGQGTLEPEEIERMKKDAELHAEEDKKEKEKVEKLNKADAAAFELKNSLKEHGSQIPPEQKTKIEELIKNLEEAFGKQDLDRIDTLLAEYKTIFEEFLKAKLSKQMAEAKSGEKGASQDSQAESEVADAEFEEVQTDKDNDKAA